MTPMRVTGWNCQVMRSGVLRDAAGASRQPGNWRSIDRPRVTLPAIVRRGWSDSSIRFLRHVLTVAHVCPWNAPNWGMMFFPGFYDGVSVAGSGAMSWTSDWRALANVTAQDSVRSSDLAVLRLYDPLGDALGYFGAKVYQPGWSPLTWGLHGYPSAIANAMRPSGHYGIGVIRTNADGERLELTHRGDSTGGNSGSPLWHFWGDDIAYAIGVQSAGRVSSTEDVNVAAGGLAMANMINFWRNAWP